jgi:hypothetical protein
MPIEARLPEVCTPALGLPPAFDGKAWSVSWVADCPEGIEGQIVTIEGLEKTSTDVLVRIEGASGSALTERLTPDRAAFVVPPEPGPLDAVLSYLELGVDHILTGIDHLLFVLALLLLVPDWRRLAGAITAFTVAHSLTMAAATLGWVSLRPAPVETVIALSIMFVAAELLQRKPGELRFSERRPWVFSFAFGLLHGFGFAGALREIGLPTGDVPLALLSFNLGVEIGQLIFVAAVLIAIALLRRLVPVATAVLGAGGWGATVTAYVIGGLSAAWFLERLVAI